jgi:hypothetical protein
MLFVIQGSLMTVGNADDSEMHMSSVSRRPETTRLVGYLPRSDKVKIIFIPAV